MRPLQIMVLPALVRRVMAPPPPYLTVVQRHQLLEGCELALLGTPDEAFFGFGHGLSE